MKFLTWLWNRGKPTFVPETSDRETVDVSTALTPQKVDAIMRAANSGDTRDQCRLAAELLEHNIEIAQAVSTRINAVLGLHWSFEPGDDTPAAKQAAEQLAREIKAVGSGDNFDELLDTVQFSSVSQSCLTLQPHGMQHTRPPCPSATTGACLNSLSPLSR